jgi:iron complex outermembrane receptor protein
MKRTTAIKKASLAGAATTALLLALSTNAMAQDAEETAGTDEVISTGIRQSIADSLALKKESSSIVEAITSEDIGKLPDVSIADSLARLPGVTAQRVRGRAQQISIRGLGPDFSIALLNGREQVSAGNNRGIEFDQFPSELIAKGIVYKTPDAKLAATGVAGAVDLRTVRPLDYTERKINLSGKYVINDNGKLNPDFDANGYRLFGSYIDQNEARTLGFSLGITHQSNPTQFFSRELKTNQNQTGQLADGTYFAADNPRTGVVSRDFKRTSVTGALQFEPTDRFSATVDAYYSDFEDEGIFRGVETPIAGWSGASLTNSTPGGAFVSSATYDPVGAILRTDTEGNSAEIFSAGLNMDFQATDKLSFNLDLSTSQLDKQDIDYESYAGTAFQALFGPRNNDPGVRGSLTYNTPTDGEYSIDSEIDYSNPANVFLTDPGGWGQVGFIKEPLIEDDLNQIRAEASYAVEKHGIEAISVGALYTDREKDFDSNESFIRAGNGFVNGEAPIPSSAGTTDSGSIGLDIVAYDPTAFRTDGTYIFEKGDFDQEWNVQEEIWTYYAMATIFSEGSIPVRGNIGFQYVDVNQASTAGAAITEESYSDFLPSANFSFEVADDTFIRVAAARSVTRPRMDQLRAGAAPSFNPLVCPDVDGNGVRDTFIDTPDPNDACISLSGGNGFLRPYSSASYDLSFEKYFSDAGAISLALFTKNISDYVVDLSQLFENENIARSLLGDAFVDDFPQSAELSFNAPENVETAKVEGIELALRLPLDDVFGDMFEGFGLNAAYTYTNTSLAFNSRDIDIPGYSKDTFSGEIYYERDGFKARVNTRHRSGFLSEVPQFDGSLVGAQALSETVYDAQIGYEWDEGPLEGFSINFEAYNITDEPFRTTNDLDGDGPGTDFFVSRREDYGTTYNITLAKKF